MEKHYIGATELLEDSFKLAWEVYESGYRPNYIVGVWRGGAPIGIAVHEQLYLWVRLRAIRQLYNLVCIHFHILPKPT